MSYSYQEGKDLVHFITEEDLKEYTEQMEKEEARKEESSGKEESGGSGGSGGSGVGEEVHEQYPGAVNEKGEINWECPCLGGLGTEGPCVEEFRSAFSCWMFSSADEEKGKDKGDECVDNFFRMSVCMQQNEEFYDDLNARNKAAAEEARAKYEAEEREALAAAEQKTQEAIAAATESESSTPQVSYKAVADDDDLAGGLVSSSSTVIVAANADEEEEGGDERNDEVEVRKEEEES